MDAEYDVVVIGARVGGAVAATLLGEAGHRVLLIDAATFPSDTVSTHFFRGAGLGAMLVRLRLLERVLELGSPPLTRQYDYDGSSPGPTINDPQDPGQLGYCLSVRRLALDRLLVERARATPGVDFRERTPARSLLFDDGGRVSGVTVEHDGAKHAIRARLVVGADGRGSRVAGWVDAPIDRREVATRAMYYRYFSGFEGPGGVSDGPEFSLQGDELVYAFPSDAGLTCLAISINLGAFATFRHDLEGTFAARLTAHRGLAQRFAASTPVGRILGTGPKDAIVRRPYGPGWALVGDAALSQDPWTGLGMDNAGTHAGFLAEAIDDCLAGRSPENTALADYHRRRDEHALSGFTETAELGRDLSALAA